MAKTAAPKKGSTRRKTAPTVTASGLDFDTYSDDYAECRATQHFWRRVGATKNRPEGGIEVTEDGTLIITQRCPGCTTKRIDEIDPRTGELIDRAYVHPAGYLIKGLKPHTRPTKSEWRREFYGALAKRVS